MVKRDEYYAKAENLYINEHLTLKDIGAKLNLNEKTVRSWKNMGAWESKRMTLLNNRSKLHAELYDFSRDLMHSIQEDVSKKEKVDQCRYYALIKILPLIVKVKDYEDIVGKSEDKAKNHTLTPETIAYIQKEILGIDMDEFAKREANNDCDYEEDCDLDEEF